MEVNADVPGPTLSTHLASAQAPAEKQTASWGWLARILGRPRTKRGGPFRMAFSAGIQRTSPPPGAHTEDPGRVLKSLLCQVQEEGRKAATAEICPDRPPISPSEQKPAGGRETKPLCSAF